MIADGRVAIDGQPLVSPAVTVTSLAGISVDGQAVTAAEAPKLWRLYKRRGTLTTHTDPEGRPTVFDRLPRHLGRVISVGRLDMNTEGLLLLTNDGGLARWLELPTTGLARTYRVRVYGHASDRALAALADGATIDGVHYGPVAIVADAQKAANRWLTVTIHEGKNREIRRLMEHLGLTVTRLIRTHYGPFALANLPLGDVVRVPTAQLMAACGAYFDHAEASAAGPAAPAKPKKSWAKAKPKVSKGTRAAGKGGKSLRRMSSPGRVASGRVASGRPSPRGRTPRRTS